VLQFITVVNISQIDLNLLHVLHAVLLEKSATRAAKRLHVTQSAVSNALARLRQALGDPLVVRNARGLSPTPRALALQPELEQVMRSLRSLVSGPERFEPATTTREFTLACADYCTTILGAQLVELLGQRAPAARLRLMPLEQLAEGDGLASNVDVHLGMPPRVPSGCHSVALFDDSFVCMLRPRRKLSRRLKLQEYVQAQHVRVSVLGSTQDAVDRALARRQLTRNIMLTVPHFSLVPLIVERTGYIATLSRRLAEVQALRYDVALCEPPLALGKRATRMLWHERTDADPGARFFRELVREAAAQRR
jgi:DNA-binding transcriptional LysR family regulator